MRLPIVSLSGIRGVVGEDVTSLYATRLGWGFGRYLHGGSCAVGRDTRRTGAQLLNAVEAGLLAAGCAIHDYQTISTPALFREVREQGFAGGVMVTASHNPPEWNGFKLVGRGGRGLFATELRQVVRRMNQTMTSRPGAPRVRLEASEYPAAVVAYAGANTCRGLKVGLDPGGGVGAAFHAEVFHRLGAEALSVHDVASVFSRGIDPAADALSALRTLVVKEECALGFAFDCDGDRLVVVDERGIKLPPDWTLALCVQALLRSRRLREVVVSVDTSRAVEELVMREGGQVHYSAVGEANVVKKMLETHCPFGGEGSSGGVIFSDFALCRDGTLAAAVIARLVAEAGSLRQAVKGIPRYHQGRAQVACDRGLVRKIMGEIARRHPDAERLDSVKLRPTARSWVLIRPSNTEDVVRVSAEAPQEAEVARLVKEYVAQVEGLKRDAW